MAAHILDTTIRDGSYEVGFQFTLEDVSDITGTLDHAGISFIEVGHGNGLFGEALGSAAAATDREYLQVAREAVQRAKLGALVGFSNRSPELLERLISMAAEVGIDFLRFGFVPARATDPLIHRCIQQAHSQGMTVSANFMRSYCVSPEVLVDMAATLQEMGIDWAYVVDSSGGMSPADVDRYVRALCAIPGLTVGFHGHNNTGMAVANALTALNAGAELIDTSLQGLGRTTGNAPTETLLTLLQTRLGLEREVDRRTVFALGRERIRSWVQGGFDPTHILAGALHIHTSSLGDIQRAVQAHGLHPDDVLEEIGIRAGKEGALQTRQLPEELLRDSVSATSASPVTIKVAQSLERVLCADSADVLKVLKVAALRDRAQASLVLINPCWVSFQTPAVVCRGEWALGVLSDAENLENLDPSPWLRHLFVDHSFAKPLIHVATTIFDPALQIAERIAAVDHGAVWLATNEELKNVLCSRLGDRVVDHPEQAAHAVIDSDIDLEKLLGMHVVSLVGAAGLKNTELEILEKAGVRLHVPDLFPSLTSSLLVQETWHP